MDSSENSTMRGEHPVDHRALNCSVPVSNSQIMAIAMVKNEQDIIEPFVRHNIRLVDHLVVLDNGSVDDTRRILSDLSREFSNLIVLDDEQFGYTQSEKMTALLHRYRSICQADYAVPLDADEFLDCPDRISFQKVLAKIPRNGCGLVPWSTFVLTPDSAATALMDPPRTFVWRRKTETPCYWKVIISLNDRVEDIVIEQGNHGIRSTSNRAIPQIRLDELRLLHFPVRGLDQLLAKSVVGWMAYLAKDPEAKKRGQGVHWQTNFERIVSGKPIETQELCQLSMLYAQQPRSLDWSKDIVRQSPPVTYERRYSSGKYLGAMELIARSWEKSLIEASPAARPSNHTQTGDAAPVQERIERLFGDREYDAAARLIDGELAKGETAALWNDWAAIHYAKADVEQAERGFRRALQLDISARQPAVNLAMMLLTQGRLQEAVPLLERHKATLTGPERAKITEITNALRQKDARPAPQQAKTALQAKPRVHSFDLFDTLLARRCADPKAIFAMLEEKSSIAGLALMRLRAEATVATQPHSLDDIYAELGKLLPVSEEELQALRKLELQLERENLIPITETITKVQDGDLIVSDMYLPAEFLREAIEHVAGLTGNRLMVSSHGKRSGQIWRKLKEQFQIVQHTGDNVAADLQSAQQNGIPAMLTRVADFSTGERFTCEAGFPALARAMREARLTSFHTNKSLRALQLAQSQLNFPLLFLASLALHRRVVAENRRQVLMSSRDCFLWHHLLQTVRDAMSETYNVVYFMTSRVARAFPSNDYLRYFESLVVDPAVIVDLCGTGWSLKRLLDHSVAPTTPIFLLSRYDVPELETSYEALGGTRTNANISHLLRAQSDVAERANFARHEMVADVREEDRRFVPVFANSAGVDWDNIPEIKVQHEAFFATLDAMKRNRLTADFQASDEAVLSALQHFHTSLMNSSAIFRFADAFTAREEKSTMQELGQRAGEQHERQTRPVHSTSAGIPAAAGSGR